MDENLKTLAARLLASEDQIMSSILENDCQKLQDAYLSAQEMFDVLAKSTQLPLDLLNFSRLLMNLGFSKVLAAKMDSFRPKDE